MKTTNYVATATISLLAAFGVLVGAGARAETYQGVHAPVSINKREDIRAEAVISARIANPYAEGAASHVALQVVTSSTDRSTVRGEAVVSVRSANPYAESYGQGVAPVSVGSVDRTEPRKQARAAARGQQLPL
ncbi:helicase SNF2 [Variovorax sp. J22P240]|uniref:helicase SNF2 n=1 Tax=Variovorax sp. J22P240 TaxID=3053514 RepID=UPI002574C68E|nr:helicase SNF2 [Variovorax sp. J22P240]MDM0001088.1 helicase SNF2 [Variovorax sp. J22P240]